MDTSKIKFTTLTVSIRCFNTYMQTKKFNQLTRIGESNSRIASNFLTFNKNFRQYKNELNKDNLVSYKFAEKLLDLGNLALAGTVFIHFIPGKNITIPKVFPGILISIITYVIALILYKGK